MRVAALYDVHGVPAALEAVLAEVEQEDVDAIVFGGDLFLGSQPAEVAALVREVDADFVRGNCDREPDAVAVEEVRQEGATVLRLRVAKDDVGKVIGRQGRIARALRAIVRASGARTHRRVVLEIVD